MNDTVILSKLKAIESLIEDHAVMTAKHMIYQLIHEIEHPEAYGPVKDRKEKPPVVCICDVSKGVFCSFHGRPE